MCMHLYVCLLPRLLITSSMMWCGMDPNDQSSKFYNFYIVAVVVIVSKCGLKIEAHCRNQLKLLYTITRLNQIPSRIERLSLFQYARAYWCYYVGCYIKVIGMQHGVYKFINLKSFVMIKIMPWCGYILKQQVESKGKVVV